MTCIEFIHIGIEAAVMALGVAVGDMDIGKHH
jgi:hypothetical protein